MTAKSLTPRDNASLRLLNGFGGSGRTARCFNHQSQMKLESSLLKSERTERRWVNSTPFSLSLPNPIADWLTAYSKRVDCPEGAVIRASLIYFATALNREEGRAMLDQQITRGSLHEVLLLAGVRRISKAQ